MNAPTDSNVSICPDSDALAAFDCGLLDDPTSDFISSHLEGCRPCGAVLDQLQRQPPADDLGSALRRAQDVERDPEPPAEVRRRAAEADVWADLLPSAAGSRATLAHSGAPTQTGSVQVGPYRVLQYINRGGMGVVSSAWHTGMQRTVALKMIKDGAYADEALVRRFRTEVQAAARLRHPNIVQVYDFGEDGGCLYFAMELIDGGRTLARADAPAEPRPFDEIARIVEQVARGAEAAHLGSVLHRDLKPSNILMDKDGTPKIGDFGLAKLTDVDDLAQTRTLEQLGTPTYMAPEQVAGRHDAIGVWTDVYALGGILYELLAGVAPFKAETRAATFDRILRGDPVPPSRLRRDTPPELEAICLKALSWYPGQRYQTAAAMADDLARWRAGARTKARPTWRGWRPLRRTKKYWVPAAVGLVLAGGMELRQRVVAETARVDRAKTMEHVRAELAAGRAVELIGPEGPPKWSAWRHGEGQSHRISDEKTGAFGVLANGQAMLDLLPEAPAPAYRLRGEISIRTGRLWESSGVYFGAKIDSGQSGTTHAFTYFGATNVSSPAIPLAALTIPSKNPFVVMKATIQQFDPNGKRTHQEMADAFRWWEAPVHPINWSTFILDVRPNSARGVWNGRVTEGDTAYAMTTCAKQLTEYIGNPKYQTRPLPEGFPPPGNAGAVGLYSNNNAVLLRNLWVEPTPPDAPEKK